jgi:epoxyqueuosine reductase
MPTDTSALKAEAHRLGFDLVGVCDAVEAPHLDFYQDWITRGFHGSMEYLNRQIPLKRTPTELLPMAESVIAVGLNYHQHNRRQPGEPHIAAYALGRDYHRVLRGKLKKLSAWIEKDQPEAKCRACVDSAPIFERDYAHLAGLGWFGKNTCLIDSKRGSWYFIGLLLTTVKYRSDAPAVGGCGTCRKCIDACPTGAIVFEGGRWQVDSRKCISYLTIEHRGPIAHDLASKMGEWTFGCDVCQEVCPFNQPRASQPMRAAESLEPDFLQRKQWPNLEALSHLDDAEWDALTQGSAIRRTGIEGMRRNAQINLENQER